MMQAILLDTETTGVEGDSEVIELAWGELDLVTSKLGEVTVQRFCPKTPTSLGALAVHHILPEELEGQPPASTAKMPPCQYLVGHNIDFDWRMLGSPPVKRIDTLAMCREIWGNCDSHTLTAMMYHVNGRTRATRELLQNAHSAECDIQNNFLVLNMILALKCPTSWKDLWEFSEAARIPKKMSFGKFRGQPISAVDKGWASWYARQEETDPYLLEALRRSGALPRGRR